MPRRFWITLFAAVSCVSARAWAAIPPLMYVADYGSGTIESIAPNGTPSNFYSGLNQPIGVIRDSTGNVYVTTYGTGVGNGSLTKISPGGVATPVLTGLAYPHSMAFDSAGYLYLGTSDPANTNFGNILKIASDGSFITFATHEGTGASDLAFDAAGNLFVANWFGGTISKITPGQVVSTYASGLSNPYGLAFDSTGLLYVSNYGNGKISTVPAANTVNDWVTAGLNGPDGIRFDADGNLYVANYNGNTISKITPSKVVTTFASGVSGPNDIAMAPEPASLGLLAAGSLLLLGRRRRAVAN